ncbi:unnamed protein product [Pelagomonas calceolata]|uniref:Uncharacterized protein n=1 Tax=Pelagomonas calceolata TaxID=35677 RepID=A0A8J2SWN1_9STRA|nr:unnamed protein product [Pelagomonas calceolata]
MLSLAGRRPGARLYAREDKPSHRSKTTSPSYLRPLHRSYRVEALGPDSIKPLVELGFWSKSVEVRRDSAAALSTLARNPDNLGTLGRSGALGATLSLLISTDDACVRDATLTLGQLVQCVELADRFMERTGGLETVLGLLRSPAPRPALVVVANLACQRGAADAIVARGGLRPLVALLRAPRHDIRNEAAGVVAELARRARDRTALGADGAVVRAVLALLAGEFTDREAAVEAAVVGFVAALAAGPAAAAALIEHGGVTTLCAKLRDQSPPLEMVAKLLRAILALAAAPAARAALVAAGALDAVAACAFAELPARYGVVSLSVLGPVDGAAGGTPAPRGGGEGGGAGGAAALAAALADPHAAPRRVVVTAVEVVDALSQDAEGAAAVVDARVLPHVLPVATVTFRRDRRLGRASAHIIRRCALAARDQPSEAASRRLAHALASQGAIAALGHHLGSSDLDSQSSSAHALAALSDARDVTAALTRPAVLTSLVALLHLPEPEAACRLIACVADKPRAARVLLDGGAAASLLGLLGPALGRSARYAVDLLNAVQRLLEAATPAERDAAARHGGLRVVRRVANTDHPARAAAKGVLRALKEEASLLLVQLAILSFLRRFRDPAWRRRFRARQRPRRDG